MSSLQPSMNVRRATAALTAGLLMSVAAVRVATADDRNPAAVASEALGEALAARVARFELVLRSEFSARGFRGNLKARPVPHEIPIGRRMSVWVDEVDGARILKSTLVSFEVRAYRQGWVAAQDLVSGQRLDASMLREAEVEIAASGQMPWDGMPSGQVLRTPVLAGKYLTAAQVAGAVAVRGGDPVQVLSRIGKVEVQARAQALRDGDPGQVIQVRVAAAAGAVPARVVGAGLVELLP